MSGVCTRGGVVCLHQGGCEMVEGTSTGGQIPGRGDRALEPKPSFTEEAQEEDSSLAHSPLAGLLRKPDHESVPPVLCEQSVEASGVSWSGFKTSRNSHSPQETPPHPSLAFIEAVTVGL